MTGGHGWGATLGAVVEAGGTTFRTWAPARQDIELVLYESAPRTVPMHRDGAYWTARVEGAGTGTRYRYRVDGQEFPDPCSRCQPEGVHGPSEVVDPGQFGWNDADFQPRGLEELVVYELHIGTFTPEGTFGAASGQFERLRELGVTAVEVMPITTFPGRWNWGYDGAALFAPATVYGGPEGFRQLVDAAHQAGLAVILDVVYNHFGPDGNYTGIYSDRYLTRRHQTPWGDGLNFDDEGSTEVRGFFRENLLHWAHEYHVDGFRFDATHAITDDSPVHIFAELSNAARANPRAGHEPYLIAESNENDVRYLRPVTDGGYGFDAVWADDFHHCVRTALTAGHEGYLASYTGRVDDLAATVEQGFLYEGETDPFTGEPRGTAAREQPWRQFVFAIQNHDQVGNHAFGLRLHHLVGLGDYLAASTLLLLLPQTPLLFQGQEFAASTPFLYFTNHEPGLGAKVTRGRRAEFAGFRAFRDERSREQIPAPQDERTFRACILRLDEKSFGVGALVSRYYGALLGARHGDPVLREMRHGRPGIETWTSGRALAARFRTASGERWLVANFGEEERVPVAGPDGELAVVVCSNEVRYGGFGKYPKVSGGGILLPRHSGALLAPTNAWP
ncbi:MAG: malto-oligosyltrehalose trehalohydrolase [Dehalococcoidia bacterium]|nr:malto-oligosyltrehalose trehalohydrolase [Dehalococcoidia bacterium]